MFDSCQSRKNVLVILLRLKGKFYYILFMAVSQKCEPSLILELKPRPINMETLRLTFSLNYMNFLAKLISFCPLTRGTVL